MTDHLAWVPEACALPTTEQPLRVAEFDSLFATALSSAVRTSPTTLRLVLSADAEAIARDLTAREAACCSFFNFTIEPRSDVLLVDVQVPASHVDVLDAITARLPVDERTPSQ